MPDSNTPRHEWIEGTTISCPNADGDLPSVYSRTPTAEYPPDRHIQPCAIVPMYQPRECVLTLVDELLSVNFLMMIVVNDGSSCDYWQIFEQLNQRKQVVVLEHHRNLGKGDALKTALKFIVDEGINTSGAVTFDCDGQHLASDVVKVAQSLIENPAALSLGVRSFGSKVPMRNRIGNMLLRYLVSLFYGKNVTDTQTGLRAIPRQLFSALIELKGGKFEYELEMLLFAIATRTKIVEVPIQTIYSQADHQSHFRPFLDSIRIAKLFLYAVCQSSEVVERMLANLL